MTDESECLWSILFTLARRSGYDRIEIHEIAEFMNIGVLEAFHLVEKWVEEGHLAYHPAGGVILSE